MTINEMVKEMEQTFKEIREIGSELKHKEPAKYEIFQRRMKHFGEWAFMLNQRVITNHRKSEIITWHKQSKVALNKAMKAKTRQ